MCTWFLVSVNCRSKTWFPCSPPGCALAACGASELSFVLSVPSGLAVGSEWLSLFCVGCDSKTVFLFSFHGVGEQSSLEDSSVVPGASPGSTPRALRTACRFVRPSRPFAASGPSCAREGSLPGANPRLFRLLGAQPLDFSRV